MSVTSATEERSEQATDLTAIRPFHVKVPKTAVADLRRRIAATRWPTKELVKEAHRFGESAVHALAEELRRLPMRARSTV